MMITYYEGFGDRTVEWEAIWLEPHYRKQGFARAAALLRWTIGHGYNRVVLFIRADNQRSLDIHKKLGAQYISTKRNEIWADGSIADVHTFFLDLQSPVPAAATWPTLRFICNTATLAASDQAEHALTSPPP
jgi:RimJ/RimL family protein N-acetyltransferase